MFRLFVAYNPACHVPELISLLESFFFFFRVWCGMFVVCGELIMIGRMGLWFSGEDGDILRPLVP